LAWKAGKEGFRVEHLPLFTANESVIFTAELYDAALEPVSESEVNITLKDEAGKEFAYGFRASGRGYRLDAGRLPAGRYTWAARTELKGERFTATGDLTVRELFLEKMNTVADHRLLADLAASTGGRMLGADSVMSLSTMLKGDRSIASRSYAHAQFTDLINMRWIFFVLLALLTVEWALRRRSGAY
ncbi:MAG TPA: hypothetical protein PK760_03325, partial [Flavobacteriales bacterium]|nr:hypothetical protein [Flavobacteriales bacterium]